MQKCRTFCNNFITFHIYFIALNRKFQLESFWFLHSESFDFRITPSGFFFSALRSSGFETRATENHEARRPSLTQASADTFTASSSSSQA